MAVRPIERRTPSVAGSIRAMPENEIPPAMRVDFYLNSIFPELRKGYSGFFLQPQACSLNKHGHL